MTNSRVRTDRYFYWKERVNEWKESGLTQASFCRGKGINQIYFSLWKSKLKRTVIGNQKSGNKIKKIRFIEINAQEQSTHNDCSINLINSLGEHFQININHESAKEYIDFIKIFLSK